MIIYTYSRLGPILDPILRWSDPWVHCGFFPWLVWVLLYSLCLKKLVLIDLFLPYRCKSRRAPEPRRQGWSRSQPTANPWQRRIWSSPAFPKGKQHGKIRPHPLNLPGGGNTNETCLRNFHCNIELLNIICHVVYATLGVCPAAILRVLAIFANGRPNYRVLLSEPLCRNNCSSRSVYSRSKG